MVKARAEITLSATVDVKSVHRYYRLQSSTAAAPTVPTSITTLPPSGWLDTEPGYTSELTNDLYTIDLTVFSDDSFAYSNVSKSSSYEAAKEAYNKADANEINLRSMEMNIEVVEGRIHSEIRESYMNKNELEEYVSTQFTQTKEQFEFDFKELKTEVAADKTSVDKNFSMIEKHIRFVDGDIILGEAGNTLTLKIRKDAITFFDGNEKVAYFSNSKLYITRAEITDRLQVGLFEEIPQSNNTSSCVYVGGD